MFSRLDSHEDISMVVHAEIQLDFVHVFQFVEVRFPESPHISRSRESVVLVENVIQNLIFDINRLQNLEAIQFKPDE